MEILCCIKREVYIYCGVRCERTEVCPGQNKKVSGILMSCFKVHTKTTRRHHSPLSADGGNDVWVNVDVFLMFL